MIEWLDFLLEAKKATYAGKGPEGLSTRPLSHDLEYRKGDLLYIDTYLGSEKFCGQEGVWVSGQPVWAMNYTGRVNEEGFNGDFLKEALRNASPSHPFRGPELYQSGDYSYECAATGDLDWFQGAEVIRLRGRQVYECFFHGGAVK